MTDLSGKTLGQYQIIELIASGGMAHIYKAYQPSMKRNIVIKVMSSTLRENPSFVDRFNREVELIAKLQHPHIVPVYDFGEEDGELFIAMAYLAGKSLADRFDFAPNGLPYKEVVRIVAMIAEGLEFAHSKGIIHRDLKPSNILFDERNNPYLVDFGLAKAASDGQMDMTNSMMAGTPHYMAPEMALDEKLTAQVDIYALGVVIYKMLCGKIPFEANTPFSIMSAHINEPVPELKKVHPDIPDAVQLVVEKAMAKDPAQRYSSAEKLASDLKEAFDFEHTAPALASPMPVKMGPEKKKVSPGVLIGLPFLLIGLVTGLFITLNKFNATHQSPSYQQHTPQKVAASIDDTAWSFGCIAGNPNLLLDLNCEKINIALENRYLPFNYIQDTAKTPHGFDYDMWWELCFQLHCEPVFIEQQWDDMLNLVSEGKFDVASGGITITTERANMLSFSQSYMNIDQRILVRKGDDRITDLKDISAHKEYIVGVQANSTNEILARKFIPNEQIKSFKEYSLMLSSLSIGDIDAAVVDQFKGENFYSIIPPTNGKEFEMTGPSLSSDQLGLPFQKDSELVEPVNRALGQLRISGVLDTLVEFYFGEKFKLTYEDIALGAYDK